MRFHTVTLEQVYATILYYLHNHAAVNAYLPDWLEFSRQARESQRQNPPPVVEKLRQFKVENEAAEVRGERRLMS
jgi:hypothetical protein